MIYLQYHQSSNFGDAMAMYIAQKLTNNQVEYIPQKQEFEHYVILGSILKGCNRHSIIWGVGLSHFGEEVNPVKKIISVRGKLTRQAVLEHGFECPEVYGDTGLIISRLYPKKRTKKKYEVGLMPHWVDYQQCLDFYGDNDSVLVMDLLKPVETVIDQMFQCENIASSSLHGLVAAHSYGIPAIWVEFSDKVVGNGFKFWDYFSGVGIEKHPPINIRERIEISDIKKACKSFDLQAQMDLILSSNPFAF